MPHHPEGPAPSCAACGASACRTLGFYESSEGRFDLYECAACRLHFVWPMRAGSSAFYARCPFYSARQGYRLLSLEKILRRDWRIRQFQKLDLPKGKLLDVGCGHGETVRAASRMGYEAFGVDLDERAIEIARRVGIANVSVGLAENAQGGPFDVITILDVLEHLENPVGVLRDLKKVLKPQGALVVAVPAWDHGPFVSDSADNPPHHLTLWTESALQAIAERAGYRVSQMLRKPYTGTDYMVTCRHTIPLMNRDILPVKALRRLLEFAVFLPIGALIRVATRCKGRTLLAVLRPQV